MAIGMTPEDRKRTKELLAEKLPQAKFYLFGSREKNECQDCDDARIAIDNGHKLSARELQELHDYINNEPFAYSFDLFDLNQMEEEERKHVLRHGAQLH